MCRLLEHLGQSVQGHLRPDWLWSPETDARGGRISVFEMHLRSSPKRSIFEVDQKRGHLTAGWKSCTLAGGTSGIGPAGAIQFARRDLANAIRFAVCARSQMIAQFTRNERQISLAVAICGLSLGLAGRDDSIGIQTRMDSARAREVRAVAIWMGPVWWDQLRVVRETSRRLLPKRGSSPEDALADADDTG